MREKVPRVKRGFVANFNELFFFLHSYVSVERTSEQMVIDQRLMCYTETVGYVLVTREKERLNFTKWHLEAKERRIKATYSGA